MSGARIRSPRTLESLEEKYAWKTQGAGGQFMRQSNPYQGASQTADCRVTGLAQWNGKLVYAIDLNGETGGLYVKDPLPPDAREGLITSDRHVSLSDLMIHGSSLYGSLACARAQRHIAQFDLDTGSSRQLTEGDTLERHPFLSSDGRHLYFDMAGFARNEECLLGIGPSEIVDMDMRTG